MEIRYILINSNVTKTYNFSKMNHKFYYLQGTLCTDLKSNMADRQAFLKYTQLFKKILYDIKKKTSEMTRKNNHYLTKMNNGNMRNYFYNLNKIKITSTMLV